MHICYYMVRGQHSQLLDLYFGQTCLRTTQSLNHAFKTHPIIQYNELEHALPELRAHGMVCSIYGPYIKCFHAKLCHFFAGCDIFMPLEQTIIHHL